MSPSTSRPQVRPPISPRRAEFREGGPAVQPPQLVEPRFEVELVRADGESEALALTGPWQDSPGEGTFWEYASDVAKVRILDGCSLGGAFWIVAAAATPEPLELVVTDTRTGNSAAQVLWTVASPCRASRTRRHWPVSERLGPRRELRPGPRRSWRRRPPGTTMPSRGETWPRTWVSCVHGRQVVGVHRVQ